MYLITKAWSVLRHHKKACLLWVGVVYVYYYWYCVGVGVHTDQLEWVEGRRELYRHAWTDILHREENFTAQGCKTPKLDPWGREVKKYVSSIPGVRYS